MENQNQSYGPIDSAQMISEKKPAAHNVRMIFITVVVLLIALGGYIVLSNQGLKVQVQKALKLVPASWLLVLTSGCADAWIAGRARSWMFLVYWT